MSLSVHTYLFTIPVLILTFSMNLSVSLISVANAETSTQIAFNLQGYLMYIVIWN